MGRRAGSMAAGHAWWNAVIFIPTVGGTRIGPVYTTVRPIAAPMAPRGGKTDGFCTALGRRARHERFDRLDLSRKTASHPVTSG